MKVKMFPPSPMITQEGITGHPEKSLEVEAREVDGHLALGWIIDQSENPAENGTEGTDNGDDEVIE